MSLDGKPVGPLSIGPDSIFYSPVPKAENAISMGKHRVIATLTDANGRKVAIRWSFTVGEKDSPSEPIPSSAAVVGSFEVPLSFFHPGSKLKGSVRVNLYQTSRGERRLEYLLFRSPGDTRPYARTTSLSGLRKFTQSSSDKSLSLSPKTKYAFKGNPILFSYVYSGSGSVIRTLWKVADSEAETSEVSLILTEATTAELSLTISIPPSDPDGEPSQMTLSAETTIQLIEVNAGVDRQYDAMPTQTGTGSIELSGYRKFYSPIYGQIVEGAVQTVSLRKLLLTAVQSPEFW